MPKTHSADTIRATHGVWVVIAGLFVVLAAFIAAVIAFSSTEGVSAALAPVTGVVGALVGAYFGVQSGAAGKAQAEAARDKAEGEATALAAVADKGPALKVLEELRQPEPATVLSDEQIDQVADAVQAKTGTSGEDSK